MSNIIQTLLSICFVLISAISVYAQTVDDFYKENLDNELVSLEELKGEQLTVIDFWATWCKPCTNAMPKLNAIYSNYKEKGVNMIGVSCDGPRSISKVSMVAHSLGVEYPILKDLDCEIMKDLQFQAFPTLIIMNNDNEVVYVHEGFSAGDEVKIEEAILSSLP